MTPLAAVQTGGLGAVIFFWASHQPILLPQVALRLYLVLVCKVVLVAGAGEPGGGSEGWK